MSHDPNQTTGEPRVEKAIISEQRVEKAIIGDGGFEKKGGYPAGPKPAKGVPPVPQGLRQPRTTPKAQNPNHKADLHPAGQPSRQQVKDGR
ncbi:hypothetical protein BZL29_7860 [Mycobacterium kansasii]|uniref:Uncharacterized protein n=1 Tax=Mycobacterium kansasii TaxID=1768 RepID=A0A1V3WEC9_MYCKA|nr:hypothetical protein BZL29_7860 [Mycobacterium kansasii]